jgi:parallel beta-helix repeat protein
MQQKAKKTEKSITTGSVENTTYDEIGRHKPAVIMVFVFAITLLAVVVPVAIYRSFAGSNFVAVEIESGSPSSSTLVSTVTDAAASGGSYVRFNVPSCPSGQQGTFPNCTTPPATCPPGQQGTPPNCTIPPPYSLPANAIIVSSSSAFLSALSTAPAGSTIALHAGTYTGISKTLSKQLTIEAYPGETVWLDGQNTTVYAFYFVTSAGGSMLRGLGIKNYAATKDVSQKPAMVITDKSLTSGMTIDRCIFQGSASMGLSVQSNNSTVTNSTFDSNNWIGLHVNHGDGIDVENNTISNNNTGNNEIQGTTAAAAGSKFTYTRGATIKNNQFLNNKATGLWIDLEASDIVINGNTITGNAHHGISYEVSTRGTITNNTIKNNGDLDSTIVDYGVRLSGSNTTTVIHNTMSNNGAGDINVYEDPRNPSNDSLCAAGAAWGADCNSYNNVISPNP